MSARKLTKLLTQGGLYTRLTRLLNAFAVFIIKKLHKKSLYNNMAKSKVSNEIKEAFDLFDKNKDGTISVKELHEAMKQAGHNATEETVKKLLKSHDKDENGVLTIDEFEAFLKNDNSVNHAELREAFDLFDINGNGYISKDELIQVMKKMGENLSDKEIGEMIRNADINKDGQVSFEEFKRMMAPK